MSDHYYTLRLSHSGDSKSFPVLSDNRDELKPMVLWLKQRQGRFNRKVVFVLTMNCSVCGDLQSGAVQIDQENAQKAFLNQEIDELLETAIKGFVGLVLKNQVIDAVQRKLIQSRGSFTGYGTYLN